MCGINQSQETMGLCPKSYASATDYCAAYVLAVQAHTRVTVFIATNACEDTLLRCHCAVSFLQSCFTLVESLHFFSPCSSPWCKSCL